MTGEDERAQRPVSEVATGVSLEEPVCELTLFVSGASSRSARAVTDARMLCDAQLGGRARLTVVDVHGDSHASAEHGVLVTPSLVRTMPLPIRTIAGDLSDTRKVLLALDLIGDGHAETFEPTTERGTR